MKEFGATPMTLIIKNNKRYMMSCVSRATSMEELGNDIYPQAKRKLLQKR